MIRGDSLAVGSENLGKIIAARAPYDTYAGVAGHALCSAHALRELQAVTDAAPAGALCWAAQASDALREMKRLADAALAADGTHSHGIVAVGSTTLDGDTNAEAWASTDGTHWTRASDDPAVLGGNMEQSMRAVTSIAGSLVAVGTDASVGMYDPAVWSSQNGTSWVRVHNDTVFDVARRTLMLAIAAEGTQIVTIGTMDNGLGQSGAAWRRGPSHRSPDGRTAVTSSASGGTAPGRGGGDGPPAFGPGNFSAWIDSLVPRRTSGTVNFMTGLAQPDEQNSATPEQDDPARSRSAQLTNLGLSPGHWPA